MAHPTSASGLRSRIPPTNGDSSRRPESFADQSPLLDEEAVLSKQQMMEEQTLELELEHTEEEKREKERLRFRDGERCIDYVIVYETPADDSELKDEEKEELNEKQEKRERFEKKLQEAGLEIEYEEEVTTKVGSGQIISRYRTYVVRYCIARSMRLVIYANVLCMHSARLVKPFFFTRIELGFNR